MDFNNILNIAEKNKNHTEKMSNGYRKEFSAPKKEKRDKPRGEVVQKLIDEKNREKSESERKKRLVEERRKHEEKKKKKFVIPKKPQDKISAVLKDLESDENNDDESVDSPRQDSIKSKSSKSHDHGNRDHGKNDKDKSSYRSHQSENGQKSHSKQNGAYSVDKHGDASSNKHRSDKGSSDKHSHTSSEKDKDKSYNSDKHKSSSSSDKHSSSSSNSDKHKSSRSNSDKNQSSSSSSDKHKSSSSNSDKTSSSNSGKHKISSSNSDKHKTSSSNSDKHKSSSSDKHKSSSADKHKVSSSGSSDRNKDKHKSGKDQNDSKHSSQGHSRSKTESSNKKSKSSYDLSLEDLRNQVKQMKAMESKILQEEEQEEKDKKYFKQTIDGVSVAVLPNMFMPHKNRQGIDQDEPEERKAKILTKTQLILQRTKERLAKEREEQQKSKRGGKRNVTSDKEKGLDKSKVKSRSIVKDDDDSDDDPEGVLDMSFNNDLLKPEKGDMIKDMKKKIDEKLGNYNFADRPVPERKTRGKSIRSKEIRQKLMREKERKEKRKEKDRKSLDKREKIKAMMRQDYESNFSDEKPKVKKPVIIRRNQQQPPPMNFNDLLKMAEVKSKEKAPEIIVKPKKKVEERPLTQYELERRQREKESRQRKKEEEMAEKNKPTLIEEKAKSNAGQKSSLLKGALTKPTGRDSPVSNSSHVKPQNSSKQSAQSKNSNNKSGGKYDIENDNVLVCGPSSSSTSKPSKPAPVVESTNPWDRIYSQIQKNNPKAEKRKRQVFDSSDEEDEYDEDDDFIDDEGCGEDVSQHIRNIFGYDKRKYRFVDEDDVDDMEANFSTIMKEEARSAKIGRMEDLEDMRMEEEELKRKKLAKMKKIKRR